MSTFLTVGADAAANLPPTRTPDQLSPDSTPGPRARRANPGRSEACTLWTYSVP